MDANLPLLQISPSAPLVPSAAKHEARGLRRSPTSWKLGALARPADDDALSATDSEEEEADSAVRRKRARSVWMQKPPRHKGMPTGVQSVLNLWKRVLRRDDVSVMSDFFHDLDGSDELAWELIEQMQLLGVSISVQQLYALRRCCVYTVLMTAL